MKSTSQHTVVLVFLAYALFLILFGWKFHPIMLHGVEVDGYVHRAQLFLNGEIPADPFRPLLYPLLSAIAGYFLSDAFVGAKLVSHLSALLLLVALYVAGRRHFGAVPAAFATLFLALNATFIKAGVQAATDMLFSALALLSLVYALGIRDNDGYRKVVVLGCLFAMTYFARYTALALLPVLCLALLWTPNLHARAKAARLAVFAVAAVVFLLPHFLLLAYAFGDPFYNENWKNLALKLYGEGDWSYLGRVPYDGMLSVIGADPLRFAGGAVQEFLAFIVKGLPQLVGNGHRSLGLPLLVLFVIGAYQGMARRDKPMLLLLSFFAVYTLLISTFYVAIPRLMLPVLPVFYLFAGAGGLIVLTYLSRLCRAAPAYAGRFPERIAASVVIGLIALHSVYLYPRLVSFAAWHATSEVDAARELIRREGRDVRLLSTYQNLKHHVAGGQVFFAHNAFNVEREDKQRYFEKLSREIAETNAQFLVVGEKTLGKRPAELVANRDLPAYLEPVAVDGRVAVYKILHTRFETAHGSSSEPILRATYTDRSGK